MFNSIEAHETIMQSIDGSQAIYGILSERIHILRKQVSDYVSQEINRYEFNVAIREAQLKIREEACTRIVAEYQKIIAENAERPKINDLSEFDLWWDKNEEQFLSDGMHMSDYHQAATIREAAMKVKK